jgi:hypothetical protein
MFAARSSSKSPMKRRNAIRSMDIGAVRHHGWTTVTNISSWNSKMGDDNDYDDELAEVHVYIITRAIRSVRIMMVKMIIVVMCV